MRVAFAIVSEVGCFGLIREIRRQLIDEKGKQDSNIGKYGLFAAANCVQDDVPRVIGPITPKLKQK